MPPTRPRHRPVARGRRAPTLTAGVDLDWREVLAGEPQFAEFIAFVRDRIPDFTTATGMVPGESFDNVKTLLAVVLCLGEVGTTIAEALDVVEADTASRGYATDVVAGVGHMADGASGLGAGAVELVEAAQREHPDDFGRRAGRDAEPIAV